VTRHPAARFARDTWLVFQRQALLTLRSPVWIAFGLAQPVTYLLLFAPVLKLALSAAGVTSYDQAFRVYVPGLLTVMAVYGGLFSGFGLLTEMRSGIVERFRVTRLSRTALLLGRALRDVAATLVNAVIITVLALPFGLRAGFGEVLLAYLLLTMLSLTAVTIGYGLCLLVRNEASLGPVINTIAQPVMLLAGVLLPLSLAPLWLLRIAKWNPFYWMTGGMRALFAGQSGATAVWGGLALAAGLAVAGTAVSVRLFARAES
jgi:ABC-2 type transport system permease protein